MAVFTNHSSGIEQNVSLIFRQHHQCKNEDLNEFAITIEIWDLLLNFEPSIHLVSAFVTMFLHRLIN